MAKKKYTFIDLFAGCGGLSEGFLQTGRFKALAHVEWEKPMVDTLRHRLINEWGESEDEANRNVILFDIQKTDELINGSWSEESDLQYGLHNADEVKTKGLNPFRFFKLSYLYHSLFFVRFKSIPHLLQSKEFSIVASGFVIVVNH